MPSDGNMAVKEKIMNENEIGSRDVAAAAISIALTKGRSVEREYIEEKGKDGFVCSAVDYGGEFITNINKIVERAVVSAVREGVISSTHREEGAVIGATREAITQVMDKAIGLNVGGKIGIARYKEHLCVCIFFAIGMLHLNEVGIGLGHRVI